MSFDSMKRSNNRHNFIAKQSYGDLPSQSPFAAEASKKKSVKKTTAVNWKDVDVNTRVSTAKSELRQALQKRHSTTHQVVDKAHEPGTVGNPQKGLHAVNTKSVTGDGDAVTVGEKSETKSTKSKKNKDGGTFNFEGDESSDDDEDVYGWRFDADGEEENDKHLEYHAAGGGSPSTVVTEEHDGTMLGTAKAHLSKSMRKLSMKLGEKLEVKEGDHPVLAHAKSFSQFAGKTLLKAGSFAARSAVKITNKLAEDVGKYMSSDEADQVGQLVERNESHMKIHDIANSPSKDRYKKKRQEELHAAVAEMRQFGEEREHSEAAKLIGQAMKERSLVQSGEQVLHELVFPKPRTPPKPVPKVVESVKKADLSLGDHDVRFTPGHGDYADAPEAVPEEHYKTLLDVKDVSHYQDEIARKSIAPINARELHQQRANDAVSVASDKSTGTTAQTPQVQDEEDIDESRPLMQKKSFKLKRPPSLQLGAAGRLRPTLKKGASFSGRMEQAGVDWEMGKGPGAGLPPLRASTFRAPPPSMPTEEDMTPVYVKKLKQTGSFLKEQFNKAKVHLTKKLPQLKSTPNLKLLTGKERIPPKPTATNGFVGSVDLAQAAFGDQESEHEAEIEQSKAPFSLLSSTMKATSFITGLKLSPKKSHLSMTSAVGREPAPVYEGNAALSDRHKLQMIEASPGLGTPVIYAPNSRQSEPTTDDLYSHVTSLSNMLEVSDGKRGELFRPASMKHLDLSRVADVPNHKPADMAVPARLAAAADVGPDLPEKEIGQGWRACWDFSAESVYYFHPDSGEASWLPPDALASDAADAAAAPALAHDDEEHDDEHFYRVMNNGLPRGLSELNLGDSELTIKTRTIAARHNLFSKLRSRYEGDHETEYTKELMAKEYANHAKAEESEILKDLTKELSGWDGGSDDEFVV